MSVTDIVDAIESGNRAKVLVLVNEELNARKKDALESFMAEEKKPFEKKDKEEDEDGDDDADKNKDDEEDNKSKDD